MAGKALWNYSSTHATRAAVPDWYNSPHEPMTAIAAVGPGHRARALESAEVVSVQEVRGNPGA